MMSALVYLGSGKKALRDVPDPKLIDATDVIIRVTHTTICGTDLHFLNGDVPEVTKGRLLGQKGVGVGESVGSAVSTGETREAVDKPVRQVVGFECWARSDRRNQDKLPRSPTRISQMPAGRVLFSNRCLS